MPEISLTDFVDFVTRSGPPRLTKVRQLRKRGPYDPIRDFWKELREGIATHHKQGVMDKHALDAIVEGQDEPKASNYVKALRGYKAFLGRKSVTAFEAPRINWFEDDLSIRINPELGLDINGQRFIIKANFKSRKLSKRRIECILLLMEDALRDHCENGEIMAVLDVQRGKLFWSEQPRWGLRPFLLGEAHAFATMWGELERGERSALEQTWSKPALPLNTADALTLGVAMTGPGAPEG